MIKDIMNLIYGGGLILMTLLFLFIWGFVTFQVGKFLARRVHVGLTYVLPVAIFVFLCVAFNYRNPYAYNNLLGALIGSIVALFPKAREMQLKKSGKAEPPSPGDKKERSS
jgi:hypothetical protein